MANYAKAAYDDYAKYAKRYSPNFLPMSHDRAEFDATRERAAVEGAVERIKQAGIDVVTDEAEGQRVLEAAQRAEERIRTMQKRLDELNAVEVFIEESLQGKHPNSRIAIELPQTTKRKVRQAMGRDFDSHNIDSNGMVHAKKNHGVNGKKLDNVSIPLRDEDFKLAPYIMIAPDREERGNSDVTGRESIRFIKTLSNGVVIVVEKEQKSSPDDMDTINMWADMSSRVADARSSERPLRSTSQPANVAHGTDAARADAVTVITSFDAAKIRQDAEEAIRRDLKDVNEERLREMREGEAMRNIRFLRTERGEVLGFTLNGEIYLDPRVAKPETSVHEYTHLWADAL